MAWECDTCGKLNEETDKYCIECYQDRSVCEIKSVAPPKLWTQVDTGPCSEDEDEDGDCD